MSTPVKTLGRSVWDLPPLILHPFNERVPPATLPIVADSATRAATAHRDGVI